MKKYLIYVVIFLCVFMCGSVAIAFRNSRDTSSIVKVDYSTLTMVCLGDSITYGMDGTIGDRMQYPYPTLVANELGLKKVYNYGINGTTFATNNLGRNSLVENHNVPTNVDIISVMCGVNDFDCSLPLGTIESTEKSTIYGAIKIIAKDLKAKRPNAFIFFITPYNTTWVNNTSFNLASVVQAIKDVCSIYDIPVLDLYKNGDFEKEMYNSNSDGLHPSQNIIKNYTAPQIAQFIKNNYNK